MPRSKIYLPDVNVWLALASRRHTHAAICSQWLNSVDSGEVLFCRITQLGLLRLLTNETVMGRDVLSSRDAWRTYQTILADERIQFGLEPYAVEQGWRKITDLDRATTKLWTDAYLVAFARAGSMQFVTLDHAAASLTSDALLLQ